MKDYKAIYKKNEPIKIEVDKDNYVLLSKAGNEYKGIIGMQIYSTAKSSKLKQHEILQAIDELGFLPYGFCENCSRTVNVHEELCSACLVAETFSDLEELG